MPTRLTILLPLKGRHLHTLRFLWHAERCRLPYHILIADGAVHPVVARVLDNARAVFPHLDIEYVRYPDDKDLRLYYEKLADAAGRVGTPYVMYADNDDFLMVSGLDRCMEFLDANRDYASCGGGVGGFSLYSRANTELSQVIGSIDRLYGRYNPYYAPHDFSATTAAQRIRERFNGSYALYYSVFRSDALQIIHREVAELNFSDLQICESYFGMRAKTLGKARLDGTVMSYFRQSGTSTNFQAYHNAWANNLVRGRFTTDLDALVDRMSHIVADVDGVDAAAVAEEIRMLYAKKLDEHLRYCYRSSRPAYHPISLIKGGLHALSLDGLVDLYRRAVKTPFVLQGILRRDRAAIVESLRSCGTTDQDIANFRRELAMIEDIVEGPGYLDFVSRHAPELLSADRMESAAGAQQRALA